MSQASSDVNLLKRRMKIETLKIQLAATVDKHGLDHPETLRMSKRVDAALNQFDTARKAVCSCLMHR